MTSVQAGHHLIFTERLEVVDIQSLRGECGFDVSWNELMVDLGCDGEFWKINQLWQISLDARYSP
jgi:hypothetical protein